MNDELLLVFLLGILIGIMLLASLMLLFLGLPCENCALEWVKLVG